MLPELHSFMHTQHWPYAYTVHIYVFKIWLIILVFHNISLRLRNDQTNDRLLSSKIVYI